MAKQDVEMKEATQKNDAESEEPQAEVSKEEKERLVLEGKLKTCYVSIKVMKHVEAESLTYLSTFSLSSSAFLVTALVYRQLLVQFMHLIELSINQVKKHQWINKSGINVNMLKLSVCRLSLIVWLIVALRRTVGDGLAFQQTLRTSSQVVKMSVTFTKKSP